MSGAAISQTGFLSSPIQAPVGIGTGTASLTFSTSTTLSITTTSTVPIGGYISVWANGTFLGINATAVATSVTDSAGNTYVSTSGTTTATAKITNFVCEGASVALPSGGTITVTYTTGTALASWPAAAAASYIPGASAVDLTSTTGATGASTSPAISTGTLGFATEIVEVATSLTSGASDTWTEGAGFTTLQTAPNTSVVRVAYVKTTTTTSQSYAPSNSSSRNWATSFTTFK